MNGQCEKCFARLETTVGPCSHCGWPLYEIKELGSFEDEHISARIYTVVPRPGISALMQLAEEKELHDRLLATHRTPDW